MTPTSETIRITFRITANGTGMGTHRDQLCGIDSEPVGKQADGQAATNAMDGKRGALITANADQSIELNGELEETFRRWYPQFRPENGGKARGTQAGRVTPRFLVLSPTTSASGGNWISSACSLARARGGREALSTATSSITRR